MEDVKFSVPEIIDFREGVDALDGIAEFSAMPFTMLGAGTPTEVRTGIVSANYFQTYGAPPALGRPFLPGVEDVGPAGRITSYGSWRWHPL